MQKPQFSSTSGLSYFYADYFYLALMAIRYLQKPWGASFFIFYLQKTIHVTQQNGLTSSRPLHFWLVMKAQVLSRGRVIRRRGGGPWPIKEAVSAGLCYTKAATWSSLSSGLKQPASGSGSRCAHVSFTE